jgi:hypothetical protein
MNMVSSVINAQVCHHPESTHPMAMGHRGNWISFGNMTLHQAAIKYASMISLDQMDEPIRFLLRYEDKPNTQWDVHVSMSISYTVEDTYPERNALDYQSPNP